jgi:preprotein translocase subunit YajC
VVTNGGLLVRITKVGESFLTAELTENVEIKLQRHAVASVVPKGTIKSA